MKRVLKRFEIPFGNISNSETLSNSMIFMREDKMTSSKHMKYELGVSKDLFKVPLKLFFNIGVI